MGESLLRNGGFEAEWGDERSHNCLVVPEGGDPYDYTRGNIFTPPGWITWYRHQPGSWDQPEVRDAWASLDPRRARGGEKGVVLFTFYRKHDAGFLQKVQVTPGQRLRLTTWAHAWSNHAMESGRPDDPEWSDGAGKQVVAWPAGGLPSDTGLPQEDAKPNFTFRVGIDPSGGTNPLAPSVVWGLGYHIYNGYCLELAVEAVAQAGEVTIFLRSSTLWAFKHNDAYWDDAMLEVVGEGPPPEPEPPPKDPPARQYDRTYVLLPPDVTQEEARAVLDEHFEERQTVGFSADDAGADHPNLTKRTVTAYRPESWPGDLEGFFETYYPGIDSYEAREMPPPKDLPPSPPPLPPDLSDYLLSQRDPEWKDSPFGDQNCHQTIGQAGCFITCLAMAQRFYGIDPEATPVTVDEALGPEGYVGCIAAWRGGEHYRETLQLSITQDTTEAAHAHLQAGGCAMAEVEPANYEHFVLVVPHQDGMYWILDPWKEIQGWLDDYYPGVQSWRLLTAVVPPEPPPPLPEPPPTEEVLLWQCDPEWAETQFGRDSCTHTVCEAGSYITCVAMAQRFYRIDPEATPLTVDETLGEDGYSQAGPCQALWSAIESKLGIKISSGTDDAAHAHLNEGKLCLVEAEPAELDQFVAVVRREDDRYWMLDPRKNLEGWLDEHYEGVQSWRLLTPVEIPEPPPPPSPRDTRGHIGLHLQTMEVGWDAFVRDLKPASCKVLASMQDVSGILRTSPDTVAIYRHPGNGYDAVFGAPTPEDGARVWVGYFRDSLHEVCDRLEQELPGIEPPYFYVESLNEVYATGDTSGLIRSRDVDMAFCDVLIEAEPRVAPVPFCAAVGNPGDWEFEMLVPLARKCEETGGLMGYHNYWYANPNESGLVQHWPYLAGRWAEMDKVFEAEGIRVRWFGGESGAVGGEFIEDTAAFNEMRSSFDRRITDLEDAGSTDLAEEERRRVVFIPRYLPGSREPGAVAAPEGSAAAGGYVFLPLDGWMSPQCYYGDWERYLADIMECDRLIREWNEEHGDRYLGSVLFTTGAHYTGWHSFQIREQEMRSLTAALLARYT